ncbi:hypothetical protein NAL32_06680 [Chryseobacterium sp. Ch-15]|uniref:Uncharacterized protein n=1 Tax=Chryseobacterium muglaense TaxID=2893752 RepID=A0A9Q3USL4_9FLAO|nr:hypothetical protein [Chryseobacterium muglaense]MBD3905786.1 hypothetical protein [Chryseobacterium muglaense]MCC9033857.1 hypothetical protein [Chryseobacterium muglaense]MCM2554077.1 hypothetical protein [Chryseobacterium muglaense]
MKKLFLTIAVFGCTFFFAQKSENYIEIGYNSICCGPPSSAPVMNYISSFQGKKNSVEIFKQSGLGREGEYKLFIGIDALSKSKKAKFMKGLEAAINSQNKSRNENSDGIVNFESKTTVKKDKLKTLNNLTIYKKENLK